MTKLNKILLPAIICGNLALYFLTGDHVEGCQELFIEAAAGHSEPVEIIFGEPVEVESDIHKMPYSMALNGHVWEGDPIFCAIDGRKYAWTKTISNARYFKEKGVLPN